MVNKGLLHPNSARILTNRTVLPSGFPIPFFSCSIRPRTIPILLVQSTEKIPLQIPALQLRLAYKKNLPKKKKKKINNKDSIFNPNITEREREMGLLGRSHGSDLQISTTEIGSNLKGLFNTLRFRQYRTSSSSVGWNRNPGASEVAESLRPINSNQFELIRVLQLGI